MLLDMVSWQTYKANYVSVIPTFHQAPFSHLLLQRLRVLLGIVTCDLISFLGLVAALLVSDCLALHRRWSFPSSSPLASPWFGIVLSEHLARALKLLQS